MIIIPSEKIYDKNNPKIIKNNYSGVSAKAQIPRRKRNDDANVLTIDEIIDSSYTQYAGDSVYNEQDYDFKNALIPQNEVIAFIKSVVNTPQRISKQFTVPKKSGGSTINSIDATSVAGSINGKVTRKKWFGRAQASYNDQYPSNQPYISQLNRTEKDDGVIEDILIRSLENPFETTATETFETKKFQGLHYKHNVSVTLKFDDKAKIEVSEDASQENYIVKFDAVAEVAYGFYYGLLNYKEYNNASGKQIYEGDYNGEFFYYVPETIRFSLNGDGYIINLQETDLFVGDNNSNVYAIQETNELMQMSPKLQENIRQVYNQYKDTGKEVATIKCSIVDYLDEQGNIAVSPHYIISNLYNLISVIEVDDNIDDYYSPIYFRWLGTEQGYFSLDADGIITESIQVADNIFAIEFTKGQDNEITFQVWVEGYGSEELGKIVFDTSNLKYGTTYTLSFKYGVSANSGIFECYIQDIMLNIGEYNYKPPMTIPMHSEVIPYVFKANGEDAPMSTYQDGSPKVFQVVGNRITYDGAVWQELTLQEVRQNEN